MTTDEQLVLICEKLLGWKNCRFDGESRCGNAPDAFGSWRQLPPLTLDLVHECETVLQTMGIYPEHYAAKLMEMVPRRKTTVSGQRTSHMSHYFDLIHATKEQRLEALVETIKGTQ